MVLQKYFYIFSNTYLFLDIFSIQEYLDQEYLLFTMKHDKYISCMLIILSRKFHKHASLPLALPFNVYLSPLVVYDTIFKSFMLSGFLP
jgi:hypothetical protein